MTFDWYQIFNLNEFLATGLVSRTYTFFLEGRGQKDILVTQGNETSIVYEDVILPVLFNSENPFVSEGDAGSYAVFKDTDENVWLGFEVVTQ